MEEHSFSPTSTHAAQAQEELEDSEMAFGIDRSQFGPRKASKTWNEVIEEAMLSLFEKIEKDNLSYSWNALPSQMSVI